MYMSTMEGKQSVDSIVPIAIHIIFLQIASLSMHITVLISIICTNYDQMN